MKMLSAYRQLQDYNVFVILVSLETALYARNHRALNPDSCYSVRVLRPFEFHLMVNGDSLFLCQMLVFYKIVTLRPLYLQLAFDLFLFIYVDGNWIGQRLLAGESILERHIEQTNCER